MRDRYTLLPKKNYKMETDEETVPGIAPPELLDTDKLFEELPMEKFAEGNFRKVRKMTRKHKIGQRVMKLDKDQWRNWEKHAKRKEDDEEAETTMR